MYVLVHLGSPCSKSHLIDIFCQRGNNPRIENPWVLKRKNISFPQ
jgi:hypothetical protein